MSILNQKVSFFRNYRDNIPKDVKLLKFLTSPKYKSEVEQIRSATSKQEKNALKSQLPAITPSGVFHTKRKVENLVHHTGLIQIDIDGKDNTHLNLAETKELLMQVEQVCFCAYSVSGNGLFALVPIADPSRHRRHFLALEQDFKNDYNIVIDKSCKDVTRLRGYSYDESYYINENAVVYEGLIEPKPTVAPQVKKILTEPLNEANDFYKALEIITKNSLDITGSNEQWFSILCGIANEFGEGGRSYAHLISQYSELYDSGRCDIDYSRALKVSYSYGIGTFYHYFMQYIENKPP